MTINYHFFVNWWTATKHLSMMKKIFTFFLFLFLSTPLFAQLGSNGHFPSNTHIQNPSGYTFLATLRQNNSSTSATNTITGGVIADVWVNFVFNTSGKNIYLVYTTNGSTPCKSNGTVVATSFEYFNNPNSLWKASIPASANTQGTTVKYLFYISDSSLGAGWGRISNGGGYETSWPDDCADNGFSYTVQAPLPVSLTQFNAKTESSSINLNWQTASETNNAFFEIERSTDVKVWETLARIDGKGTTNQSQNYTYLDQAPHKGINYYRLKQVDTDGIFAYSRVRDALIERNPDANVYPNPVSDFLRISGISEVAEVKITDLQGNTKFQKSIQQDVDIDLKSFSEGVYLVRITDETTTKVRKIRVVR